ncbi:hypothetical protein O181_001605 [Austropuccinia psidii MF-1]|uniref:Uncharacterized protein n=1 Tax=Austropuccinia psidii MF-1 TaxID=1389203 RepID=A0A9Q3GBZ8_9BASI|nr:hypothetical protein [Austropuccinia psidii MF-1]
MYYCTNGQHNPDCTSHTKDHFYAENPDLRPPSRNNKQRIPQSNPPYAHLSSAQALLTSTLKFKTNHQVIVDGGATHHILNNWDHFSTFNNIALLKFSAGDASM